MTKYFCITNENRINWRQSQHVRQVKESKDGASRPFLRDNRATIDIINDNMIIARATNGEIIAISDNLDVVINRIKYAQPTTRINVINNGKTVTLERYKSMIAPNIWIVQHSTSRNHGELVAVELHSEGKSDGIIYFNTISEVLTHIVDVQKDDTSYYITSTSKDVMNEAKERGLGLDAYELSDEQRDNSRLRAEIRVIRQEQDKEMEALLNEG